MIVLVMVGRDAYGSLYASPGAAAAEQGACADRIGFLLSNEAIVHGYGRIRVADSSWRVRGDDCPAGAKVRVVAVEDGSLLRVERLQSSEAAADQR